MKAHTSLSIDSDLLEKAKERGFNLSYELEKALKKRLGQTIDTPFEDKFCKYCNSNLDLTFLCPDEVWICDKCLHSEIDKVSIAIGTRKG